MSGRSDPRRLLDCLDFNAAHCGDVIARAYFEWSAEVIRNLQHDVARLRRQVAAERGRRAEASEDADLLAGILERIVANAPTIPDSNAGMSS